jgi:acetyl esterase/lipase
MAEDILTRKPPPYDARLSYAADPNQFGDLRLPQEKRPYLAVMIHGGFWRSRYDLTHAGHLCAALTHQGLATFNLEYRRIGNPGGGWPGTFEDLVKGLHFIQQRAPEHGIDASRAVVIGHSAGGQLALCLAAHEPSLSGAVSLAGVLNLEKAFELHLSNDAAAEFMGGTPAQVPEHFHEASPFELKIPSIRQVVAHGVKDDIVPVEFSREYAKLKSARGEHVRLVELEDAGHFELIDPESSAWPRVSSAIETLFA